VIDRSIKLPVGEKPSGSAIFCMAAFLAAARAAGGGAGAATNPALAAILGAGGGGAAPARVKQVCGPRPSACHVRHATHTACVATACKEARHVHIDQVTRCGLFTRGGQVRGAVARAHARAREGVGEAATVCVKS
jgi:hypothetical protein